MVTSGHMRTVEFTRPVKDQDSSNPGMQWGAEHKIPTPVDELIEILASRKGIASFLSECSLNK